MQQTPPPTIAHTHICERFCEHCQTITTQVGPEGNTCLQCIADGGTCCSLSTFNRWLNPQTKPDHPPRRVIG